MGVGKSSVARHVAHMLGVRRFDLDFAIEDAEHASIAEVIDAMGEAAFRDLETAALSALLHRPDVRVLSLGGGTWTFERNRRLIIEAGFTSVWLDATFEHCWLNIAFSKRDRPLARDKAKAQLLFEQRQRDYSLADWHFVIRPGLTSYEVAKQIVEEMFS